jgi:hypothetical protein
MKKILFIGVATLLLFTAYYYMSHPIGKKAVIRGHVIRLEVAVTETEKEKGLGYRDTLPQDAGMLFIYQNRDRYGFWMKGMRFPLDFVWINGNTIVDLTEKVATDAPAFAPHVPVDKVLEVNAGVIESLGIHIGDPVQFVN